MNILLDFLTAVAQKEINISKETLFDLMAKNSKVEYFMNSICLDSKELCENIEGLTLRDLTIEIFKYSDCFVDLKSILEYNENLPDVLSQKDSYAIVYALSQDSLSDFVEEYAAGSRSKEVILAHEIFENSGLLNEIIVDATEYDLGDETIANTDLRNRFNGLY